MWHTRRNMPVPDVCYHARFGRLGCGASETLETWPSPCVITPNLVALAQTIWASIGGLKNWECWAPPVNIGACLILEKYAPSSPVFPSGIWLLCGRQ